MHFRLLYSVICVLSKSFSSAQRLVSRDKTITASGQYAEWDMRRAVDGITDRSANTCNCCAATEKQYKPWYKLDLGQQYKIYNISVLGRGGPGDVAGGYGQTLLNMEIKLGTTESNGRVLIKNTDDVFVYYYTLPTPQEGRYLTLTLLTPIGTTQFFTICEISVYAACDVGRYGEKCANSCGHCYQEDTCNAVTGLCKNNCSAGYKGTYCKEACPVGKFGRNCISTCGNCLNQTICSRFNGSCDAGCELGYKPPLCQQDNAELKAQCPEVKIYQLATAIVGTIAIVIIIGNVVAAVCYVIRQRRKRGDKQINSQPDISNPYELTNRGVFETEHQYGQTAPAYEEPEAPYEIPK